MYVEQIQLLILKEKVLVETTSKYFVGKTSVRDIVHKVLNYISPSRESRQKWIFCHILDNTGLIKFSFINLLQSNTPKYLVRLLKNIPEEHKITAF